ncbi:MAG TPA: HmuY family protein [Candidatus Tidjanibacter gallistercoris]|nr:HmuY family protein [Candidatus Tidjanibacter gallistercoris]
MKKLTELLSFTVCAAMLFASCEKTGGEEVTGGNVKDYKFLDATSYTDWVYFSFSEDKIVEVSDYQNDLSWDIAFHRGDLRLNGGASGIGQGEAVNTQETDWNAVTEAPASGYVKDEIGTITTNFTGTGIETAEEPFSQTLSGWITIDTSNPPPKYTYHNYVYVVKTADGKYVKLQIYDYKSAKNEGAYISFKYQYNADGSTKF